MTGRRLGSKPAQLTAPLCKSGQKKGFAMESRMTVATRVINLISAHQAVAPEDVELLRAWTAPEDRKRTPDELACRLIEADLRDRRNASAQVPGKESERKQLPSGQSDHRSEASALSRAINYLKTHREADIPALATCQMSDSGLAIRRGTCRPRRVSCTPRAAGRLP
jgi:hypothetical protein